MANYVKSFKTEIDVVYLTKHHNLNGNQINLLQQYNNLDLSYENANRCTTLVEFAEKLNELQFPEMYDLEYYVVDEYGDYISVEYQNNHYGVTL